MFLLSRPGCRTLYEKLGSAEAVEACVALFYEKLLNDPLLAPFFEGVDMQKLAMKQVGQASRQWGPDEGSVCGSYHWMPRASRS
jgi:truncated hemoglobin YjbI